jgi:hypothetical protein
MKKQNRKPRQNQGQRKFKINPTTVTILSLIFGALGLIATYWGLFSRKTVPEVINSVTSDPIRVEFIYKYSGSSYEILPPGILPDQVDPDKLDDVSFPMFNNVTFSVTNISDQIIILSNRLPVRIIDYQPHPENVDVLPPYGGGGGSFRNFVVDIPTDASVGLVSAVFDEIPGTGQSVEDIRDEEVVDFFTLSPGEVEVFSLEVRFGGAGSYIFQPGISYFRGGIAVPVWTPEIISALVPENVTLWDMPPLEDPNEFIYREKCSFAYPRNAGDNFSKVYECNNE